MIATVNQTRVTCTVRHGYITSLLLYINALEHTMDSSDVNYLRMHTNMKPRFKKKNVFLKSTLFFDLFK